MKHHLLVLLATTAVLGFTACGPSATANEVANSKVSEQETESQTEVNKPLETKDKITVYLSGPEAMINQLEAGFEKDRGDVSDFIIMSCGQVRNKTWTEKEAGQIQADVIMGADPLIYNKLDEEDLLEPVVIKDPTSIMAEFKLADHNYYYVNERYVALIYNSDLIGDVLPTSYGDLSKADFKNTLVIADANQSATAFAITASLYQRLGLDGKFFADLKDNGVMLSKSNGLVPSTIMEGQYTIGIGPHDSVVRLKNKGKKEGYEVPLEVIWPSEGAIAIQRPIAMVKNVNRSDEHDRLTRDLINFLLSKEGQKITTKFGFASVRSDIDNPHFKPVDAVYKVQWENINENETHIKEHYQELFHN